MKRIARRETHEICLNYLDRNVKVQITEKFKISAVSRALASFILITEDGR